MRTHGEHAKQYPELRTLELGDGSDTCSSTMTFHKNLYFTKMIRHKINGNYVEG